MRLTAILVVLSLIAAACVGSIEASWLRDSGRPGEGNAAPAIPNPRYPSP